MQKEKKMSNKERDLKKGNCSSSKQLKSFKTQTEQTKKGRPRKIREQKVNTNTHVKSKHNNSKNIDKPEEAHTIEAGKNSPNTLENH